jgi:hypothetical protein
MPDIARNDVRQWDIGTWIEVDLGEDVTASTSRFIAFVKPDGTSGKWPAVLRPNAQRIGYQTVAGDLNVEGKWLVQGWSRSGGGSWTTRLGYLDVERVLVQIVED